jgi:periplasmic protein CpxP/Spy
MKEATMPSITRSIRMPAPSARSVALAALMGATMLATSFTAARADTAAIAAFEMAQANVPQTQAAVAATSTKSETVEQRITTLRAALKITPDEDAKWNAVAVAMRENASAMDKMVADGRTAPPQSMTAVDDLQKYQKFAQAHVDGLKNLISSFSTLYAAMPDAQKKTADAVFQSAHPSATAHG